jgi:phenylpyruvate tautomerase PptA (4-oxalocrotonate tautomerase family)
MPNIVIRIPHGTLDPDAKRPLVAAINETAADVERIPDDPNKRFLCWVVIDEVAPGNWTCGGADVTQSCIPVLVVVHIPAGVLDRAAGERYSAGLQRAVASALPNEARRILTSCIFHEVGDGLWGVNGEVWELKDFAAHAGFIHLQHLVSAAPVQQAL